MNYSILIIKGSNYVKRSGWIWDNRMTKLISIWSSAEGTNKKRLYNICCELEDRIKGLAKMINKVRELREQEDLETNNTILLLECSNFECRYNPNGVSVGISLKDFSPGKIKCVTCGRELLPRNYQDVDKMLFELGITY